MTSSTRRTWLACAGFFPVAGLLGGCGFQLRQPPELQLKRVQLTGFGRYSAQAAALRRALRASPGGEVVESAAQADLVLQSLRDVEERVASSTTAAGQVRELMLKVRLRFRVLSPAGRELIAPTELTLQRDMTYNETSALAKEHEATTLLRAMHDDIARQVLRRLATLGPTPSSLPAAAPESASAALPAPAGAGASR